MNDDGEENMASIDLAVTFFACVAMLFVFVSFVFSVEPPLRDRPSVGQSAMTVEAVPSDWTVIVRRSTHALLRAGTLTVISSEAASLESNLGQVDNEMSSFSPIFCHNSSAICGAKG